LLDEKEFFEDEWEGVGVRIAGRLACEFGRRDGLAGRGGPPPAFFFGSRPIQGIYARKDLGRCFRVASPITH